MKTPLHPGTIVFMEYIEPLGLTIAAAARVIGVTPDNLLELVNGKCGISPVMAIRLAQAFGGTAEDWLARQAQFDAAHPAATKTAHRGKSE